jgi:serine/threonine protein kinase
VTDGWHQIDAIFQAALERDPSNRAAFLDEACAGDSAVRAKVEALLASDEQARSFIELPVLEPISREKAEARWQEADGVIGPYKVISKLGAGGMGEIYLAKDTRLGRKVALKILPPELTKDLHRVLRFKQEARTASALNHPNILTIYEIGELGSVHFIATEFVSGVTLRQYVEDRQISWQEMLDVFIQVGSALAAAHKAAIVHRDIKPENIMIRSDGYVKVLDFGIAKLKERKGSANDSETALAPLVNTEPGLVIGTPQYMSPEQLRGLDVDGRSDIFSFGAMLYEMVAGSHPFEGRTVSEIIAAILDKDPPSLIQNVPNVPIQLQSILTRALQKEREVRYQVIEEMTGDLKRLKQQPEDKDDQQATLPIGSRGTNTQSKNVTTEPQAVIDTPHDFAGLSDKIPKQPTLTNRSLLSRVTHYKRGAVLVLAILFFTAALSFLIYKLVYKGHAVTPVPPHPIDNPSPIKLGVINQVALDKDESTYVRTSLPADEYKVVLDIQSTTMGLAKLYGSLSILDPDGGVKEANVIKFIEHDVGSRGVYRFSLKKPATVGFRLSSDEDKTNFWLTLLNGSDAAQLLPFFGKISPTPIEEAQVISGELDAFEFVYYSLPLKKGDYKALLDFTSPKGGKTRMYIKLALLDEEGVYKQNIIEMIESDVTYRAKGLFTVKNDSTVIFRLKNEGDDVKYSMKLLPDTHETQ